MDLFKKFNINPAIELGFTSLGYTTAAEIASLRSEDAYNLFLAQLKKKILEFSSVSNSSHQLSLRYEQAVQYAFEMTFGRKDDFQIPIAHVTAIKSMIAFAAKVDTHDKKKKKSKLTKIQTTINNYIDKYYYLPHIRVMLNDLHQHAVECTECKKKIILYIDNGRVSTSNYYKHLLSCHAHLRKPVENAQQPIVDEDDEDFDEDDDDEENENGEENGENGETAHGPLVMGNLIDFETD